MKYSRVDTTALREATAKAVRTVEGDGGAVAVYGDAHGDGASAYASGAVRLCRRRARAGRGHGRAPRRGRRRALRGRRRRRRPRQCAGAGGARSALAELQQRIADTLLVWNAEAYQQSLAAYAAARGLERARPELHPRRPDGRGVRFAPPRCRSRARRRAHRRLSLGRGGVLGSRRGHRAGGARVEQTDARWYPRSRWVTLRRSCSMRPSAIRN